MFLRESILILIAIVVPGGMLIYLTWKACKRIKSKQRGPEATYDMIDNTHEAETFAKLEELIKEAKLVKQLYIDQKNMLIVAETANGTWQFSFEENAHHDNK